MTPVGSSLRSPLGSPTGSTTGFFGKLPARGDFVRAGLTRGFIEPWDSWLRQVMPASRGILGETWTAAWLRSGASGLRASSSRPA